MKNRFTLLLMIAGGLLAGFGIINIPLFITAPLGAFLLAFGLTAYTAVFSGVVWGVKIKAPSKGKLVVGISAFGLIFGGYSIVSMIIAILAGIASGRFIELAIYLAVYIALFFVGGAVTKKVLEKMVSKEKNNLVLGSLELFEQIDADICNSKTEYFVVSFEGVALFSSTNYCHAVYLYENFQLGELNTVNEVALVGGYFCQKYGDRYTFKIDSEIIPGEPGQTTVAVGTGGVAIARTAGTPPQYEFKSYIFTKK